MPLEESARAPVLQQPVWTGGLAETINKIKINYLCREDEHL
jgi:hypothetical protein